MLYFVIRELQNSSFSVANLRLFRLKVLEAFFYVFDEEQAIKLAKQVS